MAPESDMAFQGTGDLPPLTWRSWLVLALFILVSACVIRPLRVPIPYISISRPHRVKFVRATIGMKLAPWLAILLLLATTAIRFTKEVVHGFVGGNGIEPYAIVILIFALAYICISLDQSGLLSYIAMHVTKKWGRNGRLLLLCFYALSTIMAVLTSNDVVVLCLTPIICIFSDVTGVDAEPFLVAMFVSANTASMALYIGNPTNIIAAQANGISFLLYSAWMALPFLGACVGGAVVLYLMCLKKIPRDIVIDLGINPRDMLRRPRQAIFGAGLLAACLITLSVSSFFGVAVWIVTLPFGLAMLVADAAVDVLSTKRLQSSEETENTTPIVLDVILVEQRLSNLESKSSNALTITATQTVPLQPSLSEQPTESEAAPGPRHNNDIVSQCNRYIGLAANTLRTRLPTVAAVVERLPYGIIPFSIGMFIIVESLSELGWTPRLAWVLKHICPSVVPAVFVVGVVTSLACNVLNNLPMTILFTRALQHAIFAQVDAQTRKGALFALIIGSNLGANFTLVGSLAGLMFQGIALQKNRNIGYFCFLKWCIPVLPVQLAISCAILAAEMAIVK